MAIEKYDSMIMVAINNMAKAQAEAFDDAVHAKITQTLGVSIDRDKLVAALQQDKNRYEAAFMRGAMFKGFTAEELNYLHDILLEYNYVYGRTEYEQELHNRILDKVNLWRSENDDH